MKKKWIILCACMLLYGGAFSQSESQQVVALQYYFDNDPGIGVAGNGEIIDLSDAAESNESFSWTLPLSVTPGYHKLYVRVADEDGRWSVAERRNVLVFVSNVNADVAAMEYYVDSDPGAGNGIDLPVSPGEWVNNNFAIDLASVSEGFHRLYIRYQNLSGAWSVSERRSFIVITPSSADDVAAMEYYLDADPGAGNGTTIPVTAGAQADGNFPVDLSAVPAGFHRIYVRHKDTGGQWSVAERRTFFVSVAGTAVEVSAIQYYFDNDPGAGVPGNGAIVDLDNADEIDLSTIFNVPAGLVCTPELYVRFRDVNGRWSVAERVVFDNPYTMPWSDFDALRTVNSFYIESELANQDSFSWDFDDGSAAETVAVNPSHTYSIPDDYDVCLTVSNSTCGARSTCHILTLPGVSGLSPSYAAPTVNFIGDVRGGGFVAGTAFVLIGEGQPDIIPTSTYVGGSTYTRIMCDLSGAAAGYRDLVVMTPDEPNDTLFDALNILSDGDFVSSIGKRPDVTINGPGNIWVGDGRISEYSISFTNNTDETMLGIPVSIELPYGIVIDEIFSDIISDTTGLGEIEVFEEFFDSTAGHYRVVAFLLLSYINPGESRSIDFNLHAESPFSSNIQVKVFSSWLSSQGDVAGKSFVPSCNDAPACVQCALDAMSLIPALSCVSSLYGLVCEYLNLINSGDLADALNVFTSLVNAILNCGVPAGAAYKLAWELIGIVSNGQAAQDWADSDDIISEACDECAMDVYDKLFSGLISMDPNMKSGPQNTTPENYISGLAPMTYQVHFENMDTATAPASFVTILDSIDLGKFDASTFRFLAYGIANHRVELNLDQDAFAHDLSMSPEKDVVVRNLGNFDPLNGLLQWQMLTYYPDTMNLIDDPLLGFLDPNEVAPEGEGYIEFSIEPKDSLAHEVVISNKASIVFDYNDAIETNTHINTIDKVQPVSYVMPLPVVTNDSLITLPMYLFDANAGVLDYNLYLSENDSAWQVIPYRSTDTLYFYGNHGSTYAFYTVARDRVLNIEDLPLVPDAYTTLDTTRTIFYADADGDSFGNPLATVLAYVVPSGYVADNTDCDDGDANEFPGQVWYYDLDGDGYGSGVTEVVCERPADGWLSTELIDTTTDCDDNDAARYPGVDDLCNGIDDDCDGVTDEDALAADFNHDGAVNTTDLLTFMGNFGCSFGCDPYDLDGNGPVNTNDLLLFMAEFGNVCAP